MHIYSSRYFQDLEFQFPSILEANVVIILYIITFHMRYVNTQWYLHIMMKINQYNIFMLEL